MAHMNFCFISQGTETYYEVAIDFFHTEVLIYERNLNLQSQLSKMFKEANLM